VSITTTTGGGYDPAEVELYTAGAPPPNGCRGSLASDVDFAPGTADLRANETLTLDAWATCLNRPELAHTTVILLGREGDDTTAGLFAQRASLVRAVLIDRGIDPARIVVGAANATRHGGRYPVKDSVRVEHTYAQTIRGGTPKALGVR
jgi:outer membrane protein OmpA-like peptidoglycan-associated protein